MTFTLFQTTYYYGIKVDFADGKLFDLETFGPRGRLIHGAQCNRLVGVQEFVELFP